jgi:hypothetical protein
VLPVRLNMASNDPVGTWRITVRELCTGKTAEARFEVVK